MNNKLANFPLAGAGLDEAPDETVILGFGGWHFTVGDVRAASKMQSAPVSTPKCALTERLAKAEKQRDDLLVALQQVTQSLEYIEVAYPDAAGKWQRTKSIQRARALLAGHTRPAANAGGLTDERILQIATESGLKVRTGQGAIKFARALLDDRAPAADAAAVSAPSPTDEQVADWNLWHHVPPVQHSRAATSAAALSELDDLRAVMCAVGIVGKIHGHDVIRRTSVLDLIDRSRAAAKGAGHFKGD